jgi:hypothetical protein
MTTEKGFRMAPTLTRTDRARELDHREADGLEVTLVWYPAEQAIAVKVLDTRTGERLEIPVDRADALEAFNHPFAYAAVLSPELADELAELLAPTAA